MNVDEKKKSLVTIPDNFAIFLDIKICLPYKILQYKGRRTRSDPR